MLTNGYKVIELQYGVKRIMLNAPVSLKFRHSIGINFNPINLRDNVRITANQRPENRIIRYQIRVEVERLRVNLKQYFLEISRFAIESMKYPDNMMNAQLNDISDLAAKEAIIPFNTALMGEYNRCWLSYPNGSGRLPTSEVSE